MKDSTGETPSPTEALGSAMSSTVEWLPDPLGVAIGLVLFPIVFLAAAVGDVAGSVLGRVAAATGQ